MSLFEEVNSGRTAYRQYIIEHGIERIQIEIPILKANAFEESFNKALKTTSILADLVQIVRAYSGEISKDV